MCMTLINPINNELMPKSQNSNIMHGLKTKTKHLHINASACLFILVPCSQSTVDAAQAMENKVIW